MTTLLNLWNKKRTMKGGVNSGMPDFANTEKTAF